LKVIYEDNHLLVIDKPAGLITQGAKVGEQSVITLAGAYLKKKYNKPGNVYVGIVSRLDSAVSGVLVVARTSKAAARLNEQFKKTTPKKTYVAITPNRYKFESAKLDDVLIKNENRKRMEIASESDRTNKAARQAALEYRISGTFGDLALVEVQLITGRKHQIRVQLANCGCPILGDRKYGSKLQFEPGIALHCRSLAIEHPTRDEGLEFESPPPKHWQLQRFSKS